MRSLKVLRLINELKRDNTHTPEAIHSLAEIRFRKLLIYAYEKSRFYQEFYRSHGIREKDLPEIAHSDLPIITKETVMENYNDFITDDSIKKENIEQFLKYNSNFKDRLNEKVVIHTSGSTGSPGLFVYSQDEWNRIMALVLSRVAKPLLHPFRRTKLAYMGAVNGHYAGITLTGDAPKIFYQTRLFPTTEDRNTMIEKLNEYQPDVISGYASTVYDLALAQLQGKLQIAPERVLSSGEHLTETMETAINMAFEPNVTNFYACTEALAMGVQNHGEKITLFNDWNIFDAVDSEGKSVPNGKEGNLIITPLYRYLQPLIRYKTSDQVTLCDCGESFQCLGKLSGRAEESLTFVDNNGSPRNIPPIYFTEFFAKGVKQFQFQQLNAKAILCKLVPFAHEIEPDKEVELQMKKFLEQFNLHTSVTVKTEIVDSIPVSEKTGKYKMVIPSTGS